MHIYTKQIPTMAMSENICLHLKVITFLLGSYPIHSYSIPVRHMRSNSMPKLQMRKLRHSEALSH